MSTSSQNKQVRRQAGYCAALLLGIVAIVKLPPLLQVVGGLAVLAGSVGLLSEGTAFLRQIQVVRRAEQAETQRREKREARREREANTKLRRNAEIQVQANAETRRRDAEDKAQDAEKQQRATETQARHERERAIQVEAQRLFALEPTAFVEAVCAAFAGTDANIETSIEKGNRDGEFVCRRPDGTLEALCILTENREAAVADVEVLEAFRRESNAAHAALISRSGFEAEAIRLSATFPMTLTDPYFIARRTQREGRG